MRKNIGKVSSTLILGVFLLTGCQEQKGGKAELKTEDDKVVYAMGAMFGEKLKTLGLDQNEVEIMAQGLKDSASGQKTQVDLAEYQGKIPKFYQERTKKIAEGEKKNGQDFIDKFVKEEGGQKTASGLAYKILKEGEGQAPSEKDEVEVHYKGTLADGTVFDSSYERNQKAKFPLNRVIKGWTEGLQLIKKGGKIKLVIPSDLAYGDHGRPPKIPGGATLVFEIELFEVNKSTDKKETSKAKTKTTEKKNG